MPDVELLSPYGIALLRLALNPRTRVADIADGLGLTERAARRLIGDLIDAGLVVRAGSGPTTVYEVPDAVRAGVVPIEELSRGARAAGNGDTRKEEVRQRLLSAVERVIGTGETYAEISVERLVTEAEISRSTFYAHFQDKADLLQALVAQVLDEMWAAAEVWMSLPPLAGRGDVEAAMVGVVHAYRTHRVVMVAAADAASSSTAVRARYEGLMQFTVDRIAEHVVEGQRAGFVRPDIDPGDTATLLTWGTERGLYKLVGTAPAAEAERAATSLADVVWNLLYAGYR